MDEIVKSIFRQYPLEQIEEEFVKEKRRTGKSLGVALGLVSQAMKNPGKDIMLEDEYSESYVSLCRVKYVMIPLVNRIIGDLNLTGFSINKKVGSIRYDLPDWYNEVVEVLEIVKNVKKD